MTPLTIAIRCTPPSVTAQQKRVRIVRSRRTGRNIPIFFHGAEMERETHTWAALLRPHVPAEPFDGPLSLSLRLVYPHRNATPKRDLGRLLPKVSAPDCDNAGKHAVDLLAKMRFIASDARIARLTVEKLHGPAESVGIQISIAAWAAEE